MILADYREPEQLIQLIRDKGLPVQIAKLDIGDYVVADIIVERKEIHDFYNSLRSRRLFDQLYNMKLSGKRGFLAVVGDIPKVDIHGKPISRSKYLYYLNTLEAWSIRSYLSYGVCFLHLKSNSQLARLIELLWRYSGRKPAFAPVLVKKPKRIEAVRQEMLGCIPKIGRKTAQLLSLEYSIRDLANMELDQLENITVGSSRLGKAKASSLYKYLR